MVADQVRGVVLVAARPVQVPEGVAGQHFDGSVVSLPFRPDLDLQAVDPLIKGGIAVCRGFACVVHVSVQRREDGRPADGGVRRVDLLVVELRTNRAKAGGADLIRCPFTERIRRLPRSFRNTANVQSDSTKPSQV
ncbi:hypothetical protein SDC9_175595 [bioreactor metagenome]|uniref:Uncharacterized protein n=1 Tax=bioreactor metagenome TaxID=1076179 RepID=A0A645GPP3_9ZZZZ